MVETLIEEKFLGFFQVIYCCFPSHCNQPKCAIVFWSTFEVRTHKKLELYIWQTLAISTGAKVLFYLGHFEAPLKFLQYPDIHLSLFLKQVAEHFLKFFQQCCGCCQIAVVVVVAFKKFVTFMVPPFEIYREN